MKISHNDPRISWHGHVSLEQTDTYTRPWRIPFPQKALFPDALTLRAGTHSGVRMAFYSDTRNIAGSILPYEANQKLDLYVDGKFFGSEDLAEKTSFAWRDLPVGEKLLEFWLPQFGDFALTQLEADEGSTIKLYQNTKPRWITYGSSITHCAGAESPSMTWPAIVAREQGFNLTCLGFGGQCHLDIQVACMMRDMPADALSICAGINIYGSDSLSARTFGPALLGFIQILREKHPETPLLLLSPIYGEIRETKRNGVGLTLDDYRQTIRETAHLLRQHGDSHIHYVSGLDLFGSDLVHLLPDTLHPNAEGYKMLGKNFTTHALPYLLQKQEEQ